MKPDDSGCDVPSMVIVRSCIASSSAAWVFGGVRLISSASSSSVNSGPLVSVKAFVWKLNRFVPIRSPGIRSGVNCTRLKSSLTHAENARASRVLPVPGGPSKRMCPSEIRATIIRWMASSWPTIARPMRSRSAVPSSRTFSMAIRHSTSPFCVD